jgi:hypothetical protein
MQEQLAKRYLRASQVTEAFGIPQGTLNEWRVLGRGPKYQKIAGRVYYAVEELDKFFREATVTPKARHQHGAVNSAAVGDGKKQRKGVAA